MYKVEVAAAITSYLLEKSGGTMNDIVIAKLQYMAERHSIVHHFRRLTGDSGVHLPWGPCLRQTVNLVLDKASDPLWDEHISFLKHVKGSQPGNQVVLKKAIPAAQILSSADLSCLDELFLNTPTTQKERFKAHDYCIKRCPEWGLVGNGQEIPLELVFISEGHSQEESRVLADEIRFLDKFEAKYASSIAI